MNSIIMDLTQRFSHSSFTKEIDKRWLMEQSFFTTLFGMLTKSYIYCKPSSPNLRYPLFYAFVEGCQTNLHVPPIWIQYEG